ncbi:MAG: hypothetical protein O9326_15370 [Microcystis sp. LE19-338.1B]|nr:hypothetical protein [Microcystis sp. LE19-338.1B]
MYQAAKSGQDAKVRRLVRNV